jgi:hypothetical protein
VVAVIIYRQLLLDIRRACVIGNAFGSPRRFQEPSRSSRYWNIDRRGRRYVVDKSRIFNNALRGSLGEGRTFETRIISAFLLNER